MRFFPGRRRSLVLGVILCLCLGVFLTAGGCGSLRSVRFTMRAYMRPGPDYDELEAHRKEHAGAVESLATGAAPRRNAGAAPYWTDFRGPGRDGVYDERPIRLDWPEAGLPCLWRQPIGPGYGSFTVAEGLAFTLEQRRAGETVAAYDFETGREVWVHSIAARFDEVLSGVGPRSTPVFADGAVYSLGAAGDLACLDASTGEPRWVRNVIVDSGARALKYGCAASPLVHEGRVYVVGADASESGGGVLAYDCESGAPLWAALSDKMSYASPVLFTIAGREQLVVCGAARVVGLGLDEGRELWEFPWSVQYGLMCAQPLLLDENHVFVSAGYGRGAALFRFEQGAAGLTVERAWRNARLKTRYDSPLLMGEHVYGLDEGRVACIEPRTGRRLWKGVGYGYGQTVLVQGHLIVLSEDGELALLEISPEGYEEKARFDAIEGMTLNPPALADGRILVRNHEEMACFDAR